MTYEHFNFNLLKSDSLSPVQLYGQLRPRSALADRFRMNNTPPHNLSRQTHKPTSCEL